MNLPYIAIVLNGLDNITTYSFIANNIGEELNPVQLYFINNIGLVKFLIIEFIAFIFITLLFSHFLYNKSKISYYVFNILTLSGLIVTVINNLSLFWRL